MTPVYDFSWRDLNEPNDNRPEEIYNPINTKFNVSVEIILKIVDELL